jgi:hypothetical protein
MEGLKRKQKASKQEGGQASKEEGQGHQQTKHQPGEMVVSLLGGSCTPASLHLVWDQVPCRSSAPDLHESKAPKCPCVAAGMDGAS